jgi:hypothetical protein
MTVAAPPRPPRPSDPVDREEIEALVEALIEEARKRAQRRRRRNGAIVTFVAVVGVALFAVLGRSAQSQSVSPALTAGPATLGAASSQIASIRLISTGVMTSSRFVDGPPKNDPKGNVIYIRNRLDNLVAQFGKPRGAAVGHDKAVYTFLSATRVKVTLRATLPGGTLNVKGQVTLTLKDALTRGWRPYGVFQVVGGTGRFAHARGTCSVRELQRYWINVYRLQLP